MAADSLDAGGAELEPRNSAGNVEANSQIICNYLPSHVTEQTLLDLFQQFGTVESAKICRDKYSSKSLGFGFVKFSSVEEAAKAVQDMNGFQISSKTIKVNFARPNAADGTNTNLYITGLPAHFTKVELDGLFSPYGSIVDSKILVDLQTGVSRGVGFVRFQQREQADAALAALQSVICEGGTAGLVIKYAESEADRLRRQRQSHINQHPHPPMFHHHMPHGHAIPLAPGAGPAAGGAAMPMPMAMGMGMPMPWPAAGRGSPRGMAPRRGQFAAGSGFGPIHFDSGFGAGQAPFAGPFMAAPGPAPPQVPAPAASSPAGPPPDFSESPPPVPVHGSNYVVYVYGLPYDCDDQLLYNLFTPYGTVASVRVMRDFRNNNACKGFGFVHMPKYEAALAAISALNGQQLAQKRLQVSFKTEKRGSGPHGASGSPPLDSPLFAVEPNALHA